MYTGALHAEDRSTRSQLLLKDWYLISRAVRLMRIDFAAAAQLIQPSKSCILWCLAIVFDIPTERKLITGDKRGIPARHDAIREKAVS